MHIGHVRGSILSAALVAAAAPANAEVPAGGATKGKVLLVASSTNVLQLKGNKAVPTGYYLDEHTRRLTVSGAFQARATTPSRDVRLRLGSKMLPFFVMGQPVKLSDKLVLDARLVGEAAERSIASQIEFWARLGRAVEPVLRTDEALRLKQRGEAVPLSACLEDVDTASGRDRVKIFLDARPYPHFEPAPGRPGLIVKIEEDGTRALGRFVNRKFKPVRRR